MFKVEIDTSNAAFVPRRAPEIARLLRVIIHMVEAGAIDGTLMNINGNTVGTWGFYDD